VTDRDFSISPSEDDREEWKAALTDAALESALTTVCAFLNSHGGRIIFGVDPAGTAIPLTGDLDLFQRRIHDMANALLNPNARQHFDVAIQEGRLYVFVRADQGRIYSYRKVVYKRTGSSTHGLTFEQAKELEAERRDHVREPAPGVFTRVVEGEHLRCPRCGYLEITGMSVGVSLGGPPGPRACPECGTQLQRG
jgi:predicted HTH transcriptional regulator